MRTCTLEGCDRRHMARGMCKRHYNQAWRAGGLPALPDPPTALEVFASRVVEGDPDECWEWQHTRRSDGYGVLSTGGRQYKAYRVSYEHYWGVVPGGLYVRHKCDHPPCVNPHHLELGTHADNMRDLAERGQWGGFERADGAKVSEAQVVDLCLRHAAGESCKELADAFSLSESQVYRIASRKAFRWVEVPEYKYTPQARGRGGVPSK